MRALLALGLVGCATAQLEMPMTAARAVQYNNGPALVAYLGQPDASPQLCDVQGTGPHLPAMTPELRKALVDGLHYGHIPPATFRRCANAVMKRFSAEDTASLFDALFDAYHKMLVAKDLDGNPSEVERLSTIQRMYLDRQPGRDPHPAVLTPLLADIRAALAKKQLGRIATRFGQELLDTVDIEHGTWQGQNVDAAVMDALAKAGNELTLHRFTERLPSEPLRIEASRRVVRIHIALSPFAEVQQAGPELEQAMIATGHNAVKLADHPVVKASFGDKTVQRGVVVREHVWQRTATLLGSAADRKTLSVLPELPLRGALLVELKGISHPVTLCGRDKDLDPSPCIVAGDLSLGNPLTKLDANGVVKVDDSLPITALLPLAAEDGFAVSVRILGQPAATLTWPLRFELPEPLTFHGGGNGGHGPNLTVHVADTRVGRLTFDVNADGRDYIAIIEGANLPDYKIASIGGAGASGSDGLTGSSGSDGSTCGNGGDGGRGGDGGNGGDGGDGGDIAVQLSCTSASCGRMPALLAGMIVSAGGPGGAGGSGGAGGVGGSGGNGQSPTTHTDSEGNTVVDDPGCSAGSSGSNGASGSDGSPGSDGHAGRVSF